MDNEIDRAKTTPVGGYGPEFWRSKIEAFEGFKKEAMANGCSEEKADAYILHWRERNDADVQLWSQEYWEYRSEARKMFDDRNMIPNNIEKWHALVLWGQKKSRLVGDKLQRAGYVNSTLQMRQAVAHCDAAMQVADETETEVFRHLHAQDAQAFKASLNLLYLV